MPKSEPFRIRRCSLGQPLLLMLGVLPYVWIAYLEYQVHLSGMLWWELVELAELGKDWVPYSAYWTILATGLGLTLVSRKNWAQLSISRNRLIIFSFTGFALFLVVRCFVEPRGTLTILGQLLRYVDYLLIAPALALMCASKLSKIIVPFCVAHLLIGVFLLSQSWTEINWATIFAERTAIGTGGRTSGISTAYLALVYAFFVAGAFKLFRGLWYRILYISVYAVSGIVIYITFSRAAVLALVLTILCYLPLRFRSLEASTYYFIGVLVLLTLGLTFSDLLFNVMSRQDILETIDANRFTIWESTWQAATADFYVIVFGAEKDAVITNAHNLFLAIFSEFGILALVCYVFFHVAAILSTIRALDCARTRIDHDFYARVLAVLLGIIFAASLGPYFSANNNPVAYLYFFLVGVTLFAQRGVDGSHSHNRTDASRLS